MKLNNDGRFRYNPRVQVHSRGQSQQRWINRDPSLRVFCRMIDDITTPLYQLSIPTRLSGTDSRKSYLSRFQILNSFGIFSIFPTNFLVPLSFSEMMGKSHTRQRQFMMYYRNHHDIIARCVDLPFRERILLKLVRVSSAVCHIQKQSFEEEGSGYFSFFFLNSLLVCTSVSAGYKHCFYNHH